MVKNRLMKQLAKIGRTQTWLAAATGMTRSMVSFIASGRSVPTPEELRLICGVLGCRAEELYQADALAVMLGEHPKKKADAATKNVRMTQPLIDRLDAFRIRQGFPSRDEAARAAIWYGMMAYERDERRVVDGRERSDSR